jgi:hypothetical protein
MVHSIKLSDEGYNILLKIAPNEGRSVTKQIDRGPITNKLKLIVMQDLDEGKNSTCFYG